MATRKERLGRVIKRAQERTLPAGPCARTHRADVAGGEDHQEGETLGALHDLGEIARRIGVLDIARLGNLAHQKMVAHQPGDSIGFGSRQAKARAEFAGDGFAGLGMILGAALGDIVQEQRHIEQAGIGEMGQQFVGERKLVFQPAIGDVGHDADGADQVLVHRIVVIHVELHQRDDLAELGHQLAQHAGLVHAAQDALDRFGAGEDFEEIGVYPLVGPQFFIDQAHRPGQKLERIGVEHHPFAAGHPEYLDDVDRVLFEHLVISHGDAAMLEDEIGFAPDLAARLVEIAEHAAEGIDLFGVGEFERGAEDAGQIAHVLGD